MPPTAKGPKFIRINHAEVRRMAKEKGGDVDLRIEAFSRRVLGRAKQLAPAGIKPGSISNVPLKSTIRLNRINDRRGPRYLVGSDSLKTSLVHEGTSSHPIPARRVGGYLAWFSPEMGRQVVIRPRKGQDRAEVFHRGSVANPFLKRALDEEIQRGI